MKVTWDFSDFDRFADRLVNAENFERFARQATREIAEILQDMLYKNTPVKTGNLMASWGGQENCSFTVQKFGYGYSVTLKNNGANDEGFKYGLAVNDGHYSYNQFGGPYRWVEGRFFVEASVIQTANSAQLESVIMRELQKWWDSV